MTPEQRSEFDRHEAKSKARVGGAYREKKLGWIFSAIYPIPMALMFADDLTSRDFGPITFYGHIVLICILPIVALYSVWFIWQDERFAILEDGLGRVTRNRAVMIPWDQIEDVGSTFPRMTRLTLRSGEKVRIGPPEFIRDQIPWRVQGDASGS